MLELLDLSRQLRDERPNCRTILGNAGRLSTLEQVTNYLAECCVGREKEGCFCTDMVSTIHSCFGHFSSVMHLAKVRAHRDFHQATLRTIPALWKSLTAAVGVVEIEHLQCPSADWHPSEHELSARIAYHRYHCHASLHTLMVSVHTI